MIEIYNGDSLAILVTVLDRVIKDPVDITTGTVTAEAQNLDGTVASATTAITDGPAGKFTATFTAGALGVGSWSFQARVVIGGDSMIVATESVLVLPSHI